jgi:hypothetical protein
VNLTLRALELGGNSLGDAGALHIAAGTQFTYFTSTKVQIRTRCTVRQPSPATQRYCAQFTCFTSTKVQIRTRCTPPQPSPATQLYCARFICFSSTKSTNTSPGGTQFTFFTSTKVQILTRAARAAALASHPALEDVGLEDNGIGTHLTLLYWYKSTNTDAEKKIWKTTASVLTLLALLVQKYKY